MGYSKGNKNRGDESDEYEVVFRRKKCDGVFGV